MKIAVLGGYGLAGFRIAQHCARLPAMAGGEILLLGRDTQKLAAAAATLQDEAPVCAIAWCFADADDITSLRTTLMGCALVIVATSGVTDLDPLIRAVLLTDTDLLDILPSTPQKIAFLQRYANAAVSKGLCFITDGGLLPGLPGVLGRYAEAETKAPSRLNLFASFNLDWRAQRLSPATQLSFFRDVLGMTNAQVWRDGAWIKAKGGKKFSFPSPVGPRACVPMDLKETRDLVEQFPTLQETGFYISGFGKKMDWIVMPFLIGFAHLFPNNLALWSRLFFTALRHWAPQGAWFRLCLRAQGPTGPCNLTLASDDPYDLTAIATVGVVDTYLAGHRPRGLWTQAAYVDPIPYMRFLAEHGVSLQEA